MKRTKKIKYSYWAWLILRRLNCYGDNANYILVHNKQENTLYIYDIIRKEIISSDYDLLFDLVFSVKMLGVLMTLGESGKFYKSLPKKYKDIFWDSVR